MNEKTAELRDIFMDVSEEETVTESQAEQRGSLLTERSVDDRLIEVIERMRDRDGFETELDDDVLGTVVRRFYDGDSDEEIATILKLPPAMVVEARLDMHLVREDDTEGIDTETLRERLDDGQARDTIAAALGVEPGVVTRATRALDAQERSRRASQRFRTEFEEILTDADIAVQLTAEVQEDGLDDATEGMEVDVEF
jgi:hypothetical protein